MVHLIAVVHSILTIWQTLHHLHSELVSLHVLEILLRVRVLAHIYSERKAFVFLGQLTLPARFRSVHPANLHNPGPAQA